MSKTTKIIAALGVVAGLGVAALPAFSYAADPQSATGDVEVQVEVLPAIAMTITGNNDGGTHDATHYVEVSPVGTEDPSEKGWYESDGAGGYTASVDTEVDNTKTYYEKVPASYSAVDSFNPADIASTTSPAVTNVLDYHNIPTASITGTSSSYAKLLPNALFEGSGAEGNGFRSTITVYTNANAGYTLSVKDKDSTTALTHIENNSYTIPAQGSALAAGTAGWNFDVIRHGATESVFTPTEAGETEELTNQAITASDVEIDNWTAKTDHGRDTVVDYNVATAADQATGVYSDIIVYTATTR